MGNYREKRIDLPREESLMPRLEGVEVASGEVEN